MDKQEFKNWQTYMGYKNKQAAEALGVSEAMIEKYRIGYPIRLPIEKLCNYLMQCKLNIEV